MGVASLFAAKSLYYLLARFRVLEVRVSAMSQIFSASYYLVSIPRPSKLLVVMTRSSKMSSTSRDSNC